LDVSVAGTNFHGSASPSLANLLKGAAEQIEHPTDPARSLWEMKDGGDWKTYNQEVKAFSSEVDFEDLAASRSGVGALGSGSDYTAFLQRYGVASTDMGYGGGPNDPPYHYHSIYDSFTWQSRYGDPGFVKHTAAAKMLGLMALRLADSLVLPLNVTQYAHDLSGYLAKFVFSRIPYDTKHSLTNPFDQQQGRSYRSD
jgi:N-acetylated-alpha-linked acidic dipeptidase